MSVATAVGVGLVLGVVIVVAAHEVAQLTDRNIFNF